MASITNSAVSMYLRWLVWCLLVSFLSSAYVYVFTDNGCLTYAPGVSQPAVIPTNSALTGACASVGSGYSAQLLCTVSGASSYSINLFQGQGCQGQSLSSASNEGSSCQPGNKGVFYYEVDCSAAHSSRSATSAFMPALILTIITAIASFWPTWDS